MLEDASGIDLETLKIITVLSSEENLWSLPGISRLEPDSSLNCTGNWRVLWMMLCECICFEEEDVEGFQAKCRDIWML